MIAADTIEEKLSQIIQNKQSVLTSTLDGGDVEEELTIFDELQKEMTNWKPKQLFICVAYPPK